MAKSEHTVESFTRNRSVVIGAALAAMLFAGVAAWLAIAGVSKVSAQWNPLPIREVRFAAMEGGMTRVDAAELKRIAGGIQALGGSMLRTDLSQVKAVVKQVEWVRDVDVRRRFPGTLEIRVEEQKPFARWQLAGAEPDGEQSLLVNSFGEVFEAEADAEEKLPLLAGPPGSSRDVMMQFAQLGRPLAALGRNLAELRLSPRRAWQAKLDNGSTIELGRNDAELRLARFIDAYPRIAVLQEPNARIDMRYQTGLAVRAVLAKPVAATKLPRKTNRN
jgi:cell division protein FtsQ